MTLTPATFPTFFEALWGYPPFDWQKRLLKRVHDSGWPSTLDLPTGAGKTAALDVALFALALDTARPPEERRQSRRIVLVIDRRVVVDQAFQRATQMAKKLDEARDGVLAEVATALRSLSGNGGDGLPVLPAILRGGMPRESEWAKSPSQPVILVSTVDQVGSRLLFRGYGVSDRMRPVHAGLLGRDTLLLLDEVHLARPFEETLAAITRWYHQGQDRSVRLPAPLVFVRMSATVADASDEPFGLSQEDRNNSDMRARLTAQKRAVLRQVKTPKDSVKAGDAIAKAAVREVERLGKGEARSIAVIVNRVDTARKVASLARQRLKDGSQVSLLTGRMRPLDRLERQSAVLEHVSTRRKRSSDSSRLLLVSTQAIEAGADFDFDALVTECASLDALRQRFGRLDRLGDIGVTDAVILVGSSSVDEKAEADPIYGGALKKTWNWLQSIGEMSEAHDAPLVDFGIDSVAARLADLDTETFSSLVAPRAISPVLTSSHLRRWVQTSPAPHADPDVAPFLHGMDRGAPEVQILWRADIEERMLSEGALPIVQEMLEAVRPSSLEALSVPLWTAKSWLALVAERRSQPGKPIDGGSVGSLADVEGTVDEAEEIEGATAAALLWRSGGVELLSHAEALRPGETIVVPSSYGGLDPDFDGWDPESEAFVRDRGDEAQLLQRGRAVLRWAPATLASWGHHLPESLRHGPRVTQEEVDERGTRAERDAFEAWKNEVLAQSGLAPWVHVTIRALGRGSRIVGVITDAGSEGGNPIARWRATWHPRRLDPKDLRPLFDLPELRSVELSIATGTEATTEGDEGSFLGNTISLSRHLDGVRGIARAFSTALHLEPEFVDDLGLAGWIHDLGKADPRFQLLLHGGDPVLEAAATELLAKSSVPATDRAARERARSRAGYPSGMRHELMSVALALGDTELRNQAHDWDLVLHLVAAHHGWCRPFAPPVADPQPLTVSVELDNQRWTAWSAHDLQRFDSSVPERFWQLVERYGYWGLAWFEAVLRLADHRESEVESSKEPANG